MGHRRAHHLGIHLRRRRARRPGAHRCSRSATRSSRSSRSRARHRASSTSGGASSQAAVRGGRAEIRSGVVHLLVPLGTGDPAFGRSRVPRAGDLPPASMRSTNGYPICTKRCPTPAPSLGRAVGLSQLPTTARTSRAGARRSTAVRDDQPRGEAGAAHPGRDQAPRHQRHHGPGTGGLRPLRYGDMLDPGAPARQRCSTPVIQALKHAGIPVAGADRLKLTEHIAIIDLMELADALLLPQDDLALAVALKSPLFGLDDDRSVQARLRAPAARCARRCDAQAATDERFSADAAPARTANADFTQETPFAFYAWLLGGDGGRARMPAPAWPRGQ